MDLGETIYRLRTERGLSQGDLADVLDVSRQSVSKWETNGSVPELDKLVKLSQLFGVTLDELVLGGERPEQPDGEHAAPTPPPCPDSERAAPTPPPCPSVVEPAPARSSGITKRELAGILLLCFGGLVWLLISLLGDFLTGLFFAAPFVLCGVICLVFRRNVGLWCAWALFLVVDLYLRWATGVQWRTVFLTLIWTREMNYVRLAVAWVQLGVMVLLTVLTVLRFRRIPLPLGRRTLLPLLAGWVLWAVTLFLPVPLTWAYHFFDLFRWILLTMLLVFSARCLTSWRAARRAADRAPGDSYRSGDAR